MLTWIIPVYNGEHYLSQTVESILNQPCKNVKIIIVDDGSTDNTLSIANSFKGERVSVIHKENGGVSSARNFGIKAAETNYIAFLDADDVLCKDVIDDSIISTLASEQYDLLSFAYFVGDQTLRHGKYIPTNSRECVSCASEIDHFKHCSSFIYHRSLFNGVNSIHFPEGIRVREDVTFQFLINHSARNCLSINRGLFIHRNNVLSVMHNLTDSEYMLNDVIPAWEWCKQHSNSPLDKKQCDVLIFAEAVSYIQLGCMDGIPLHEIQAALSCPAIQESLMDYSSLWHGRRQEYEAFLSNPNQYWIKHRIRGILFYFLKNIARLPIIRIVYMRMRYRDNITCFLYP